MKNKIITFLLFVVLIFNIIFSYHHWFIPFIKPNIATKTVVVKEFGTKQYPDADFPNSYFGGITSKFILALDDNNQTYYIVGHNANIGDKINVYTNLAKYNNKKNNSPMRWYVNKDSVVYDDRVNMFFSFIVIMAHIFLLCIFVFSPSKEERERLYINGKEYESYEEE